MGEDAAVAGEEGGAGEAGEEGGAGGGEAGVDLADYRLKVRNVLEIKLTQEMKVQSEMWLW